MPKLEWGKKHSCTSCGALFYDMKKDPVYCPSCGQKVDQQPLLKPRRTPAAKLAPKSVQTGDELNNKEIPDSIEPDAIEEVDIDHEDVELNDDNVDLGAEDEVDLIVDEDIDDTDIPEVAEHLDTDNVKE